MGDNLNDFLSVFRKKSVADRLAEVDKINDMWGTLVSQRLMNESL
jgi:predicted secreted acid phosphatase